MNSTHRTRTRWTRLLDSVLPAPSQDRLVRVAEVSRGSLALAEGSLADVQIASVAQETRLTNGASRFTILVAARDCELARQSLAGF